MTKHLHNATQDGAQFYAEPSGDLIASYPEMVENDYDMRGAELARDRFLAEHPEHLLIRVHQFDDSGEAYDASQSWDQIAIGDLLVIAAERIVAVAHAWPVAVTAELGKLHGLAEDGDIAALINERPKYPQESLVLAAKLARSLSYDLHAQFEQLLDWNHAAALEDGDNSLCHAPVGIALIRWHEINESRYNEMLEILPPAYWGPTPHGGTGFLVGEASNHNAAGFPTFAPFREADGKFYEASHAMTVAEFTGKPAKADEAYGELAR